MGRSDEFEKSFTWSLVKDYLGQAEQQSFEEVFVKHNFHVYFDPVAKLLVEPVPPDSNIKWVGLLTKAFSKVQSTLKKIDTPSEKAMIEEVINTLVGIMKISFLESYDSVLGELDLFMAKAIENARSIHNTNTFSLSTPPIRDTTLVAPSTKSDLIPCTIKDEERLSQIEACETFMNFLLEIIPSRDLLFEQIRSGSWTVLIECKKTRQYAVAAFFDQCKSQEILIVRFSVLSLSLVDENGKVLSKRIDQLSEKGRNGRYEEAESEYNKVLGMFEQLKGKLPP